MPHWLSHPSAMLARQLFPRWRHYLHYFFAYAHALAYALAKCGGLAQRHS